jgi:hypothetical protein
MGKILMSRTGIRREGLEIEIILGNNVRRERLTK